ncbi:ABC transporter permease [Paenibacillus yanchengensis]|uniref:ABC transporter permease n=1 Tax=Paenibacillus yanchengensis TaxID=2035833 RepID=A0ABW4YM05_9BACL
MSANHKELERLWVSRANSFAKEAAPYFRIMSRSGLLTLFALVFILGSIQYVSFLQTMPETFPIGYIGAVLLTFVLCYSPLRTWLQEPDTVFVMVLEHQMGQYMKRSIRRTVIQSAILLAVVLLLYLPLYNKGIAPNSMFIIILISALLKGANGWLAWQERRMIEDRASQTLRLVRIAATALAIAAWLHVVWWQAALFTLLLAVLIVVVYRLPQKFNFPWQTLIAEEARTSKRFYLLFGMFTDIPALMSKPHRRPYLSWIIRNIAYSSNRTYVFLYTATLLRLELIGIVLRLLLLASFVTYWAASVASMEGWLAFIIYAVSILLIGLQLGGLGQAHRDTVWKHVYPLSEQDRIKQFIIVDKITLLTAGIILLIVLAIPLLINGYFIPVIAAIAFLLLYLFNWRPKRMAKKMTVLLED